MNAAGVPLRRATPADVAAIQAVLETDPTTWHELEGAELRPDEAERLLRETPGDVTAEHKHVYVGEGIVLNFVEGYPDAATWYLGLIFLAPALRSHGLGAKLLAAVASYARARGGRTLRLAVVPTNVRARRLYERLGFSFITRKRRGDQDVDVFDLAL